MKNAWENVSLMDYEAHMQLSEVFQLQTLNIIMKSQINTYKVDTLAILGIAGGNGLEHIKDSEFKKVYGIDINDSYLMECKKRFPRLTCLELLQMDIADTRNVLPVVDLVIANLVIEYIGIEGLCEQLLKHTPNYFTCVIQKDRSETFVSSSPYEASFAEISKLHVNIEKEDLIQKLESLGLKTILQEEYLLPNGKKFLRIDFQNSLDEMIENNYI